MTAHLIEDGLRREHRGLEVGVLLNWVDLAVARLRAAARSTLAFFEECVIGGCPGLVVSKEDAHEISGKRADGREREQ